MSNSRSAFVEVQAMGLGLIINRNDYNPMEPTQGVGIELLEQGAHELGVAILVSRLAVERKKQYGQGVVILDCGANIGHLTVFWANVMEGSSGTPWGQVISFEPQKYPFMMLCGNIVKNNCYNVDAHKLAIGAAAGKASIPLYHPLIPYNAGGITLGAEGEPGQPVDVVAIDDMPLKRLDILKLDIEGMEPAAILGARKTIEKFRPIIIAETHICGFKKFIDAIAGFDYMVVESSVNSLCVHKDEINPTLQEAIKLFKSGLVSKAA